MSKNKKIIGCSIILFISIGFFIDISKFKLKNIVMGGEYIEVIHDTNKKIVENKEDYSSLERFFRPSKSPIINDKIEKSLYDMYGNNPLEIKIDNKFLKTPEDTIINYFSVLREAANPPDDINTGCGSLGDGKGPYPVAYNFLTTEYKNKLSYKEYLKSFENKLHINLVKLNKVLPDENRPNDIKYFVELEVIEGSKENKGTFAYYYGYIYLDKEDGVYKIKDINYNLENYLCAPYHGWAWDAKLFVETEYGEYWCNMIDSELKVEKNDYEKKVYFKDKDGNEYYVLFYQLTNGVDIKIADYKKDKDGNWKGIYIDNEKCLDKNKK